MPDPAAPSRPADDMAALWGSLGAHLSWGKTTDRSARTAPARRAAEQRFLDLAEGDPVRAEHLRKAHYKMMAMRSVAARRARKAAQ